MELETVIGLEIHVQLKTKSKMFCSCINVLGEAEANTAICPICLGYPGTLPVPNQTAIAWTQRAGAALNCKLASVSKFDRKSYFYPDLPKAYQISQYDQPLCGEGGLEIIVNGERVTIGIERIHLEEDAAKNTHPKTGGHTLVDYNRAGTPLMEIVTKPDLRTAEQAKIFLQELQRIMRLLGISDADMEKGHMRCDANISLRPVGKHELYPKTEIKNVNSFKFVAKALEYEITRQRQLWAGDGAPQHQATRGFDAESGVTVEQRNKEAAADYRYFPDPDIPPLSFTVEELQAQRAAVPELPLAYRTRLMRHYGVSDQQAEQFANQRSLGDFFEAVVSELQELNNEQTQLAPAEDKALVKRAANVVLQQLRAQVAKLPTASWQVSAGNFAELVVLIHQGKVGQNAIAKILVAMQSTGGDPDHIIETLGLAQVTNSTELTTHVAAVIAANPDVVAKIAAGKDGAIQYLMGQVMARTQGTANPEEVIRLIKGTLH